MLTSISIVETLSLLSSVVVLLPCVLN